MMAKSQFFYFKGENELITMVDIIKPHDSKESPKMDITIILETN